MQESFREKYDRWNPVLVKKLVFCILTKEEWASKMVSALKKCNGVKEMDKSHLKYGAVKNLAAEIGLSRKESRKCSIKIVNIAKSCKSKPKIKEIFHNAWDVRNEISQLETQLADSGIRYEPRQHIEEKKDVLLEKFNWLYRVLCYEVLRHPGRKINNKYIKINFKKENKGLIQPITSSMNIFEDCESEKNHEEANFVFEVLSRGSDFANGDNNYLSSKFKKLKKVILTNLEKPGFRKLFDLINYSEEIIDCDLNLNAECKKELISTLEKAIIICIDSQIDKNGN